MTSPDPSATLTGRSTPAGGEPEFSHDPAFQLSTDGVHVPRTAVSHRETDYPEDSFGILFEMQERHFWYRGRHRFVFGAMKQTLTRASGRIRAIDLGAGCGGWLRYLEGRTEIAYSELAMGDSSMRALRLAATKLSPRIQRYQVDLLTLPWDKRWDAIFLLDVIEHVEHDVAVLHAAGRALRPGGLLYVTVPAIQSFWTYNDDLAHHKRRYSKGDFRGLAREVGLTLVKAAYFMFFLSPVLLLARARPPRLDRMTPEEIAALTRYTHRVPSAPLNAALGAVFAAETPLGLTLPFPWGTSLLGVFQRPL